MQARRISFLYRGCAASRVALLEGVLYKGLVGAHALRCLKACMKSRTFSTVSMVCGLYMVMRIASDGIPSGCDRTSSHPSFSVSSRNLATSA